MKVDMERLEMLNSDVKSTQRAILSTSNFKEMVYALYKFKERWKMSSDEYREMFEVLKSSDDYDIRASIRYLFETLEDPETVPYLIEGLKNEDIDCFAAKCLGIIKDPRGVQPLVEILRDNKNYVMRRVAADALGYARDPLVVECLLEALNDDNKDVRKGAMASLAKIKDKRSVEPLIEILKGADDNEKSEVVRALQEITGKIFIFNSSNASKWSRWWEKNRPNG